MVIEGPSCKQQRLQATVMHTHDCTHTHIRVHTHTHTYECAHTHTHTRAHTHTHTHTRAHTRTHTHTHIHTLPPTGKEASKPCSPLPWQHHMIFPVIMTKGVCVFCYQHFYQVPQLFVMLLRVQTGNLC